jgi:hypothetical protein
MIHPKDGCSNNPRLQCSVCRRWMRLHGVKDGVAFQRYYGGCHYTTGDHLAGDGAIVCDQCCQRECAKLSSQPTDTTAAARLDTAGEPKP